MKTSQYSLVRTDKVVLDELTVDGTEGAASVCLGEVSAFILMADCSDQDDIRDCKWCEIESHE